MKVSIILPYYNRKNLLLNTLKSFEYFYKNKDIEVIIIDDTSNDDNKLNDIKSILDVKIIRLENKTGINPCYPYNVGIRQSSGEIIILSSPETFHTTSMFDVSNNFSELNDETYLLFSVFCITEKTIISEILNEQNFDICIKKFKSHSPKFYENLGEFGYPYNNRYGSWYLHSKYRNSGLNFFSAITRKKIFEMSGFDERFRFGTGYDDNEFKDRLLASNTKFIYYDNAIAIHVNHEIVNNTSPITNYSVYLESKNNKYQKNDSWGKH